MATTIKAAVERLTQALDAHFNKLSFEWKSEESQSEHRQSKPTVFAFTCSERNGRNFPVVCPSVTIELRGVSVEHSDRLTLEITCHCVVVNSAILEREKTVKIDNTHIYLTEEGYTDEGVVEALFSDCLLLGEEVMDNLRTVTGVSNVKLTPPDAIDDFPYAQCQVTATVNALPQYDSNNFRELL